MKVIETFGETLRIKTVELLKSDNLKYNITQKMVDENTKLSLLKYLYDDGYKEKVISTFSNEQLKLEGLKQLKNDSSKIKIISSLTDINLIEQSLSFIEFDQNKVIVINSLTDEVDRLNLSNSIKAEWERIEVLVTITSDKLKARALSLLTRDDYKAKLISTIRDENIKYELLRQVNEDSEKITIISSFKNEDLLYSAISQLKNEYNKASVLVKVANDNVKYKFLSLINSEDLKANIINSMSDNNFKINAINLLTKDNFKLKVINKIEDELVRVNLISTLEKQESQFIVIAQIKSNEIKVNGLKTINNYQEVMRTFFKNGSFEYLYHFDKNILKQVFDDKQMKILNEYSNIKNEKIRKLYSIYVSANYENINMENLDKISQILFRIEMSNSSELQAFGDLIAKHVLNHDNPLQYFSKVEDIFVKNNIPYVGKIFEVFKLLHSNSRDYRNYSPLLNRFKDSQYQIQIMDLIIFNDLLKCAFGSNNRSLKEFITEIDKGNNILTNVMTNKTLLNSLNNSEKIILIKYLDKIEIILDSYDKWKNKKTGSTVCEDLLLRINYVVDRLNLAGNNYKEIPDIIVKKLCGISGIDTFESAKKYFEYIISETDKRNREKINGPFILEEGDFVKGINDVKYLSRILQNGSVSKEFLGDSSNSDATPLDTDLSRILLKDMNGKQSSELGRIIGSTISGSYGSTWFVLKNDPSRIEITRNSTNLENGHNLSPKFSKLEAFKTLQEGHYGIRTGFPTSEISYIVSRSHFDRIGLEIAMNGFYIPVVNMDGKLVFTPEDYDILRSKMSGLSYYGENNYVFSNNLVNEDTSIIVERIGQYNTETKRKSDLINSLIKESLLELGLVLKDKIDGDLSEGTVELIDIGSTGRGTNKPDEGDFDFMMRLDKSILSNPSKMDELKKNILKRLEKENSSELTSTGDFRLKKVKIDDDTCVDIDITFTMKTDKVSYSTDMCLQERLSNIYNQNPQQYNYVVANILLAKQVLKQGDVYKPNRGEIPQGGLGGVGIENWILQNGGSFIDAAKSFLDAANGKTFEEFKNTYYIWDFGENHMAERRGQYSHDNFVSNNMSQSGYNRMIQVLNEYVKKYEYNQSDTIRR